MRSSDSHLISPRAEPSVALHDTRGLRSSVKLSILLWNVEGASFVLEHICQSALAAFDILIFTEIFARQSLDINGVFYCSGKGTPPGKERQGEKTRGAGKIPLAI